jgi:alanyl-tRNA synthetase
VTERLYYADSFLSEFQAVITQLRPGVDGRTAVVLDRTAFYPDSGGQRCDTGRLHIVGVSDLRVVAVAEDEEDGEILHVLETSPEPAVVAGTEVSGSIDSARRSQHRQDHSGQHILSAAFVRLFQMATLSFHMGEASCTIDLDARALTADQLRQAEELANAVVLEDRPVEIRWATPEQAQALGARKIPPGIPGKLRLIDIQDFDLNACGGTHVARTGQVGAILVRKCEKTRQGMRVEFVCGASAVRTAASDYTLLTEAAALFSTHILELPQQIRKSQEEIRAGQKERKKLLEELAELQALQLMAQAVPRGACQLITWVSKERELAFLKLVAHKICARAFPSGQSAVALLGCVGGEQPAMVFAQTPGGPYDMNLLMRGVLEMLGGRGGGNKDLAQGGAPAGADVHRAIAKCVSQLT